MKDGFGLCTSGPLLCGWNHHCYHDYCSSSYTHRTHKSQTHEKIMTQITPRQSSIFLHQNFTIKVTVNNVKIHTFGNNNWLLNIQGVQANFWGIITVQWMALNDLSCIGNLPLIGDWIKLIAFPRPLWVRIEFVAPRIEKPRSSFASRFMSVLPMICTLLLRSFQSLHNYKSRLHISWHI